MKFFIAIVGLCLACFASTLGHEENALRNELQEMVMNGVDFEIVRNRMSVEFGGGALAANETCTISIRGPPQDSNEDDPIISATVKCGSTELYNQENKLSELKPQTIKEKSLFLFHNTPYGFAYVYLRNSANTNYDDILLENLPKLNSKTYAAPFVAIDGRFECNRCHFHNNVGGEVAGAVVLGGTANVDINRGDFYSNQGSVGALKLMDTVKVDIEETIVEENIGTIVGGIMAANSSTLVAKDVHCIKNQAVEHSTSVYITGTTLAFLDETHLVGEGHDAVDVEALTAPESANYAINEAALSKPSTIKIEGNTFVSISGSNFSSNVGKYGSVLVTEEGVVSVKQCRFEKNIAVNGAGIYVEGGRGGYARVMYSQFVGNVARNGGGMVSAGNGTFVIRDCTFESNQAFRGGAIWGDYSNEDSLVNATCARSSAGARVTITNSEFGQNSATDSGGAFYVKCTDILTERSTFIDNSAASNGGAMYVEDVHDLDFQKCTFDKNRAGGSGGSLFTKNSHDILSADSTFTNSVAESSGGAILSLNGHGIYLANSTITSNTARNGGAIYSLGVEMIESHESDLTQNAAEEGGAFSLHNLNELHLESVDLSKNKAERVGGAVRAFNGREATIKNVIVTDIKSGSGSLSLGKMGTVSVSDIDFHDNIADRTCGALEIDEAVDVHLTNIKVRQNVAKKEGGGLCISKADAAELRDVKFTKNTAGFGGGALLFSDSKVIRMDHTEFMDNSAATYGGAIKGKGVESLLITFSTFERNEAKTRGGAIFLDKSSLTIQDCNVTKNYVGQPKPKIITEIETETAEAGKTEIAAGEVKEPKETGETETASTEVKDPKETGETETASTEVKDPTETGETKSDTPEVMNSFRNIVSSKDAGGVIYLSRGRSFKSLGNQYHVNEAQSVGGTVMVEDMDLVDIQFDTFMNGTASMSGGCIYGANVRNFSMWDTHLQYCDASHGGAFILEGNSMSDGGYNKFINNTADSGGAFLCKGNSRVDMKSTKFIYNAANEGATLSIDCRCDVDVENSVFYREKERRGNGDFFHTRKGCGSVNHNGCEFYGEMDHNGLSAVEMGIGGCLVALLVAFIIFVVVVRRRRAKKKAAEQADIETGPSDPLLPPSKRPVAASSTEGSSSYETETETETEEESEESEEVTDLEEDPRKRVSTRSVVNSEKEEISPVATENDTDDEGVATTKSKPRSIPTVPVVPPPPIGVRTPKEVRAAARHRKASTDMLNDGAGPSLAASPDILPPILPPKLKLNLSISRSYDHPLPSQTVLEENPDETGDGEIQPVKVELNEAIPEDSV